MNNNQPIQPEWLASERDAIENEWIKKRFYTFIENLFKEKTTFERYGLLILFLQLLTIACSVISYMTSHIFTEKYVSNWTESAEVAFWTAIAIIFLIELIKIIGGTLIFMRLVQFKRPAWWLALIIGGAFGGSMYGSYSGGFDHVVNNTAPTLENIDSLKQYYDTQIASITAKVDQYRNGKEYRNSEGELYHTVLNKNINPLESEVNRLAALRDSKVESAESKNATIEQDHDKYTTADASVMAWIALGADLVKILISIITARFLLSCRMDLHILNREEDDKGEFESEFGMLKNMPPTEAPKAPESINPESIVLVSASSANPRDIPLESLVNSKNSKPCIVIQGFNKGKGMTESEVIKKLRDSNSRLKSIQAYNALPESEKQAKLPNGKKKHKKPGGKIETVKRNIATFEDALKKFG